MQASKLLVFTCFALAATVGASTSIPPVITPSISFTPLPPCTLGGDASCSTGSVCTPITNCIGQCYSGVSSPTILPTSNIPVTATTPVYTCQVGFPSAQNGCSSGSYCLPTQTCAGLCLNTVPLPPATTTTLPTTLVSIPPSGITTPPTSIPSTRYNCVVNEYDSTQGCPTSSFCTPVGEPCYGICSTTTAPYSIGTGCIIYSDDCGPNAVCSQNAGCEGTCIAIPAPTTTPPTSVSSTRYNCVVNEFDVTQGCPTSSFCTPVGEPCYGQCTTTTAPYSVGTTACLVLSNDCGANAFCSQNAGCQGTCVAGPPPTITGIDFTPTTTPKTTTKPTSTQSVPSPSGTCGWVYIPCGSGYKCVNQAGENCGVGESGHCVPVHHGKHRFLAGRYFDAGEG